MRKPANHASAAALNDGGSECLASVGLWLSVGATGGVTAVGPWLARRLGVLGLPALPVAVTVGVQLGVALPSLLVFGRLSLIGTVANLVAVPAAGLVMLYGLPACLVAGVVPVIAPVVMAHFAVGVRWIDAVATLGAAVAAWTAVVVARLGWRGRPAHGSGVARPTAFACQIAAAGGHIGDVRRNNGLHFLLRDEYGTHHALYSVGLPKRARKSSWMSRREKARAVTSRSMLDAVRAVEGTGFVPPASFLPFEGIDIRIADVHPCRGSSTSATTACRSPGELRTVTYEPGELSVDHRPEHRAAPGDVARPRRGDRGSDEVHPPRGAVRTPLAVDGSYRGAGRVSECVGSMNRGVEGNIEH